MFSKGKKSVGYYGSIRLGMLALLGLQLLTLMAQATPPGGVLPKPLNPFLETHCFECHDDVDEKGGLNLLDMSFDLGDRHGFEIWRHVYDRVKQGEMPPKKKTRPPVAERDAFLKELGMRLQAADSGDIARHGRVRGRRLTRTEYEHTVQDLLGISLPLKEHLPAEESGTVFDSEAKGQQFSHFHLEKYLQAADMALNEAFTRIQEGDVRYARTYNAKQLTTRGNGNYRGPELREGKVHSWAIRPQFSGRLKMTRVPKSGWYRVTIKNLSGVNMGPDKTAWGTLHTGAGYSNSPLTYLGRSLEAVAKPKDVVCDTWIRKGHLLIIKPNEGDNRMGKGVGGGTVSYKGKNLLKQGVPGLVFDGIRVERIYPGGSADVVRKLLMPGISFSNGKPQLKNPEQEIKRLVSHFASRAFRRPVTTDQVAAYHGLALSKFKQTQDVYLALHEAYRAILCSPRMLTFVETVGKLDDYAIATRLSYLFWSSIPDAELLSLASDGALRNPVVLKKQMQRMLADKKSDRFIQHFTDQWLNLKEIDFTTPDPRRFRPFDPVLQDSMVAETRAFIRELIDEDLSVKNFIRSDFAMLDTRLKTHYALSDAPVVAGKGLQKVSLKPNDRSGLVTQGSVLKVTADGSVTSPVARGVWVGERILGLHIPPPPPNVGAIEPDIRGAKNIRDQLAKHRKQTSCAACHEKIDPQGFALELFDPIGRTRQYYGQYKKSVKVDTSGVTPEGDRFAHLNEWKKIYEARPEMLTRAFAEQLYTYATGASGRFSDRADLDKMVSDVKARGYGMRSIIEAVVTSERFLSK